MSRQIQSLNFYVILYLVGSGICPGCFPTQAPPDGLEDFRAPLCVRVDDKLHCICHLYLTVHVSTQSRLDTNKMDA